MVIKINVIKCKVSERLNPPETGKILSVMYLFPIAVNKDPTITANFSSLISSGNKMLLDANNNEINKVINNL